MGEVTLNPILGKEGVREVMELFPLAESHLDISQFDS